MAGSRRSWQGRPSAFRSAIPSCAGGRGCCARHRGDGTHRAERPYDRQPDEGPEGNSPHPTGGARRPGSTLRAREVRRHSHGLRLRAGQAVPQKARHIHSGQTSSGSDGANGRRLRSRHVVAAEGGRRSRVAERGGGFRPDDASLGREGVAGRNGSQAYQHPPRHPSGSRRRGFSRDP